MNHKQNKFYVFCKQSKHFSSSLVSGNFFIQMLLMQVWEGFWGKRRAFHRRWRIWGLDTTRKPQHHHPRSQNPRSPLLRTHCEGWKLVYSADLAELQSKNHHFSNYPYNNLISRRHNYLHWKILKIYQNIGAKKSVKLSITTIQFICFSATLSFASLILVCISYIDGAFRNTY